MGSDRPNYSTITNGSPSSVTDPIKSNLGVIKLVGATLTGFTALDGSPLPSNPVNVILKSNQLSAITNNPVKISVPAPPTVTLYPATDWVNVNSYGANPDKTDATQGFINAINYAVSNGKSTIYVPHGTYEITNTITIPKTVCRIIGYNSTLHLSQRSIAASTPLLAIKDAGSTLMIERLNFQNDANYTNGDGNQLAVQVSGNRDVVFRDISSQQTQFVDRTATGGRIFVEDYSGGPLAIAGSQPAFLRQVNPEHGVNVNGDATRITNTGSTVWVLGLKTEGGYVQLNGTQNSISQIDGGFLYASGEAASNTPSAYLLNNSFLAASFIESTITKYPNSYFTTYLIDTESDGVHTIYQNNSAFLPRDITGNGRLVPLVRGGPGATRP